MGFSFIVTSIVLVICSSYRIHISLRAHEGVTTAGLTTLISACGPQKP
jgi:hypothetical protein